jgi:hypothetical protein
MLWAPRGVGVILGSEAMNLVFRDRLFGRRLMVHVIHLQHDTRCGVWH